MGMLQRPMGSSIDVSFLTENAATGKRLKEDVREVRQSLEKAVEWVESEGRDEEGSWYAITTLTLCRRIL